MEMLYGASPCRRYFSHVSKRLQLVLEFHVSRTASAPVREWPLGRSKVQKKWWSWFSVFSYVLRSRGWFASRWKWKRLWGVCWLRLGDGFIDLGEIGFAGEWFAELDETVLPRRRADSSGMITDELMVLWGTSKKVALRQSPLCREGDGAVHPEGEIGFVGWVGAVRHVVGMGLSFAFCGELYVDGNGMVYIYKNLGFGIEFEFEFEGRWKQEEESSGNL